MKSNVIILTLGMFGVMLGGIHSQTQAAPLRVMAMGDSITYGETAQGMGNNQSAAVYGGYRTRFFTDMQAAGVAMQFVGASNDNPSPLLTTAGQTAHSGYRAWTIGQDVYSYHDNFVYHAVNWVNTYQPDVILLHGGTNDILLDAGWEKTAGNMRKLLNLIYATKPDVKVYVAGIIPVTMPGREWYSQWHIKPFNEEVRDDIIPEYQTQGREIEFVDQFVNFTTGAVLDGTHLPDGIHPDQVGYDLMGATFAAAVIGDAVPEPGTLSLLVLGAAAMLRRRVWVA